MNRLLALMEEDLHAGALPAGLDELVEALEDQFGNSLQAVLLYGSCRRQRNIEEGLADLLVIVSSYREAYQQRFLAWMNRWLPPNVFYLESRRENRVLRSKYAVMTFDQFRRRCQARSDHYFWARFCQPMRLAHAKGELTAPLAEARALAAANYAARIAPLVTQTVTAQQFWETALTTTYRCELRPEPAGNAARLIGTDPDYWARLTEALAENLDSLAPSGQGFLTEVSTSERRRARWIWRLRAVSGKLYNLARLFKAAGTFSNGIDYIAWKVERHSGVRVEPTDTMRRYPRLAAWGLIWRMWRQGGFK
ncbi:MAG: hypothetical protein ACXIUB_08240 [Wenzhouxiangella sp.]